MDENFAKFRYDHLLFTFSLWLLVMPSIATLRTLMVRGMRSLPPRLLKK
jgi:hypothetical protein